MRQTCLQLQTENIQLKNKISSFEEVSGIKSYINDTTLKGGYRVVKSIQERDSIDCCHKKIGMIVSIEDTTVPEGYSNYRLVGTNPCTNNWIKVDSDGVAGPPGPQGETGPPGPSGEISVLNFDVNNDMHLIMQIETNTTLDFILDDNGHLIVTS